jgi:CNT family concentrative nucleoside transporter
VTCLLLLLASLLPFPYLTTIAAPFHFAGVPRSEILQVSELLATKLITNEFAAYLDLQQLMASPNALSKRGFTITTYALCGFANLSSLAIMIGVLSAMAPSRHHVIARIAPSAMISGFLSTLQAAGIAYVSFHSSPLFVSVGS